MSTDEPRQNKEEAVRDAIRWLDVAARYFHDDQRGFTSRRCAKSAHALRKAFPEWIRGHKPTVFIVDETP